MNKRVKRSRLNKFKNITLSGFLIYKINTHKFLERLKKSKLALGGLLLVILLIGGYSILNHYYFAKADFLIPGIPPIVETDGTYDPGVPPDGAGAFAYWKFDANIGMTFDNFVGAPGVNDGTRNGQAFSNGNFGYQTDRSLYFDVNSAYVDVGTLGNFGSQSGQSSYEAWIKTDSTSQMTVLSVGQFGQGIVFGLNYPDAPGTIFLAINAGSSVIARTPVIPNLLENNWHHIAASFDNSTSEVKIYFDGASQSGLIYDSTATLTTFVDFTEPVLIGARKDGIGPEGPIVEKFIGEIDNVIVYNSIRSDGEFSDHYTSGLNNGILGAQEAYWKFDESSGTTTADDTTHGNIGTLVNAPDRITNTGDLQFQYANDRAITLNGIDQYVNVGKLGNFGGSISQNSFEFWYKSNSTDSGTIFGTQNINEYTYHLVGLFANTGADLAPDPNRLGLFFYSHPGEVSASSLATSPFIPRLNDGNWHHIVTTVKISSGEVIFYFDGSPLGAPTISGGSSIGGTGSFADLAGGFVDFDNDLALGAFIVNDGSPALFLNGSLDNVIFYNTVLNSTEVYDHYLAAIPSSGLSGGDVSAGGEVNVSAAVDASLLVTIDQTLCNLGILSTSEVRTCPFTVGVQTNAVNGYNVYVKDTNDGKLLSGTNIIPSASGNLSQDNGMVNEGFGLTSSVSVPGMEQNLTCENGASRLVAAVSSVDAAVMLNSGPTATDSAIVCVGAIISQITPAGNYSDNLIVTVVGNF